jgi:hypothetical protein
LLGLTTPKGFSATKCDVGNWTFSKSKEFFEKLLGKFLDFLGNFLENFLGGIFWEEFLGGIFWEEFFWKNIFGRNFWEDFFGGFFWEDFFGRNSYIVKVS